MRVKMNEILHRLVAVAHGCRQNDERTSNGVSPMAMTKAASILKEPTITDNGDEVNILKDEHLYDGELRECRVFRVSGRQVGFDGAHITWDSTTRVPIGTRVKRNDGRIYEVIGVNKTNRMRFESVMMKAVEDCPVRIINNM